MRLSSQHRLPTASTQALRQASLAILQPDVIHEVDGAEIFLVILILLVQPYLSRRPTYYDLQSTTSAPM